MLRAPTTRQVAAPPLPDDALPSARAARAGALLMLMPRSATAMSRVYADAASRADVHVDV